VVHDRHPEIEDDALAGPCHDELADAVDDGSHEEDRDEDDDKLVEQSGLFEAEVEHPLHDLWPHEAEGG